MGMKNQGYLGTNDKLQEVYRMGCRPDAADPLLCAAAISPSARPCPQGVQADTKRFAGPIAACIEKPSKAAADGFKRSLKRAT